MNITSLLPKYTKHDTSIEDMMDSIKHGKGFYTIYPHTKLWYKIHVQLYKYWKYELIHVLNISFPMDINKRKIFVQKYGQAEQGCFITDTIINFKDENEVISKIAKSVAWASFSDEHIMKLSPMSIRLAKVLENKIITKTIYIVDCVSHCDQNRIDDVG